MAAAGLALVSAGCTGASGDDAALDDVVTFETEPRYARADAAPEGSWPAVVLHDETLFQREPGALVVHGVADGEETARFEPEGTPLFEPADPTEQFQPAPALADVDGDAVVLAGFAVEPATGATQLDVEMVAVDAASGEERWRVTVPEPGGVGVVPQREASVRVAGVDDGVAVVTVGHDGATQVTFGLSLGDEPEVLWADDSLYASGVHDGVAVGFAEDEDDVGELGLAALDVATGDRVWGTFGDIERFVLAGPWVVATRDAESSDGGTGLVAVADGTEGEVDEGVLTADMICEIDEAASVAVCAEDGTAAVAFDTENGDVLWSDDAWEGTLKGLWRGAAYVERGDAAVALDARTGEVVVDDAGAAPAVVNDHVGVDQQGTDVVLYATR
ncbi:PQQ-binding-like beta-propeller repeat protein [Isoptericola sp. BMS4]|uniref:outer membrane protein assembly factor BamB family protein n=1 Tax=Isoptericola sp. BMS4 TaxID=2527875 RepID=UPI00141EAD15|nr:PQQ-binding-like beta-propeller repeat protein [Isoptericola sp. BMS4]